MVHGTKVNQFPIVGSTSFGYVDGYETNVGVVHVQGLSLTRSRLMKCDICNEEAIKPEKDDKGVVVCYKCRIIKAIGSFEGNKRRQAQARRRHASLFGRRNRFRKR